MTRENLGKAIPLTRPEVIPAPERRWPGEEWERIRLGHRSSEMEDKWDAFVEGDRLHFHRSWTGYGIYEADFGPDDDGWVITAARVTGDREVYARSTDGYESLMLEALTAGVLLGRWPEDRARGRRGLGLLSVRLGHQMCFKYAARMSASWKRRAVLVRYFFSSELAFVQLRFQNSRLNTAILSSSCS